MQKVWARISPHLKLVTAQIIRYPWAYLNAFPRWHRSADGTTVPLPVYGDSRGLTSLGSWWCSSSTATRNVKVVIFELAQLNILPCRKRLLKGPSRHLYRCLPHRLRCCAFRIRKAGALELEWTQERFFSHIRSFPRRSCLVSGCISWRSSWVFRLPASVFIIFCVLCKTFFC